jgi:prepilin-type N-terminal cleavage/methylation domain-containing protein
MTTRLRATKRQGFTLIEVMVSLGIMSMGAMAMIALQTHTIRSNAHARQLTTAMQIAQRWVERFKQDAISWRQVGVFNTPIDAAAVLAGGSYLKQITPPPNVFQPIVNTTPGVSNAFDYQGNDIPNTSTDPPIFYCAAFRPAWVFYGRAMRVDVRVWWPREDLGTTITTDFPACDGNHAALNPGGTLFNNYHIVYLPTVIRMVVP